MTVYVDDPDFTLHHGDVLDVLPTLPDQSVNCVITSPPYWGLRDYGTEGQLGLEQTPDEYVARMVDVFREVRRVLRDDGTLWLNLGSSYATGTDADRNPTTTEGADVPASWAGRSQPIRRHPSGFKPKDMVPIPWMVAMALQQDGWFLRADIIWSKPNPMPESVTDRPTKAHEYVFLLSKQPRYWFDQEAVREPAEYGRREQPTGAARPWGNLEQRAGGRTVRGSDPSAGRNVRSVWEIATQPYAEAHFATYPQELVRRCLLAGCPEWVCGTCGKPRERITAVDYENPGNRRNNGRRNAEFADSTVKVMSGGQRLEKRVTTEGWSDCGHDNYRPGTVLDPFMGSGTTAFVARHHGRRSIGVELNADYCQLAAKRLSQQSLLAGEAA